MLRSMVTPAMRCSTSVTERSGSLPMSSATIESTTSSAFCLSFCADCSAARWPLTTTTAPWLAEDWEASQVCCAQAAPEYMTAISETSEAMEDYWSIKCQHLLL